jgi:tripartite-type tricarboxylate transporter receptor subunit TctC
MKLPRRKFLHLAAGAAAFPTASRFAWAQSYPTRPVHIVVGFAAGINPDIIARLFAQSLSEQFGQQFVVDDRPGAASNLATEIVVNAAPDGYTLLAAVSTNTINATLYDKLNFDFIRDIAPVAGTVRLPSVIVATPSFTPKTVGEFISYAKANPGKITMASSGTGSAAHVFGALFAEMAGISMLHVPYRASYMPDLLSGQVQVAFAPMAQVIDFIGDRRLRALAVTSAIRSNALPDTPAVAEFLSGYDAYVWDGIGAPMKTPHDIIEKLNRAVNICLADPAMKTRLATLGAVPLAMTPAEFGKFMADETKKWANVIRAAGIKPE